MFALKAPRILPMAMKDIDGTQCEVGADDHPSAEEVHHRLRFYDSPWLDKVERERWTRIQQGCTRPELRPLLLRQAPVRTQDLTLPVLPPGFQPSDHVRLFRSFDWSSTDFGPMTTWSPCHRRAANYCLNDQRACAIFFGPKRLAIYNEAYAAMLGLKHPSSLGRAFIDIWNEPGPAKSYESVFDTIDASGVAVAGDDVCIITERYGFREEMFASWTLSPMIDFDGNVFAITTCVVETTQKQLSARRLNALLSLSQCTSSAKTLAELWKQMLEACNMHHADIPFAILYSLALDSKNDHLDGDSQSEDSRSWSLEGSVGLGSTADRLPTSVDSASASRLLTSAFRDAMASAEPHKLTVQEGTFPKLIQGVARSRTYGDPCQAAIMFPISPTNRDDSMGFMIIGINPVIRYTSDHEHFIQHLVRQCASLLASILMLEDETNKTQLAAQAAAQDRIKLSAKLAVEQKESREREVRFQAMADLAPVGMFHIAGDGTMIYANKRWVELTQHPPEKWAPMSWMDSIYPDDVKLLEESWAAVLKGEAVSFEMRLNTPWTAPDGTDQPSPTWAICSAYAEMGPDDSVVACLGCLTDITHQKWMETLQDRRMKEVLELKKQQENFMDMTSHEARNPLAAIMLCAESLADTMQELLQPATEPISVVRKTIETQLEGAETILACAQHQKRIMDDVLTLSKINSGMFMLCPVPVQLQVTITQVLRMMDAEVQKHDIDLKLVLRPAVQQATWAVFDPSRLTQILINLLSNAIKFTRSEAKKSVTLTVDATDQPLATSSSGIKYIQDAGPPKRSVNLPREEVCLCFEVADSGCGLTPTEIDRLFQRFQQASPKTHVEYGGSGLGLFISRQLTRMQGGAIGVSSNGNGTTFAFYITALRCDPPVSATIRRKDSFSDKSEQTTSIKRMKAPKAQASKETTPDNRFLKRHILLVEDNLINQNVIRTQLQRLQYTVEVANHGLEALDYVLESWYCMKPGNPLDLILMDVEMPVCNGTDCTRQIRAMEQSGRVWRHIPIIGISANVRAEQQLIAVEAGMDSMVPKPFRLQELAAELERILALHLPRS